MKKIIAASVLQVWFWPEHKSGGSMDRMLQAVQAEAPGGKAGCRLP